VKARSLMTMNVSRCGPKLTRSHEGIWSYRVSRGRLTMCVKGKNSSDAQEEGKSRKRGHKGFRVRVGKVVKFEARK